MNNTQAALQNGKVWSRRYEIPFNKENFEVTLLKVDPECGSALSIPLMLILFKKINTLDWSKDLDRREVRMVAFLTSKAMCKIIRKEESNILKALGEIVNELGVEYKLLFTKYSVDLCSLISSGIDARTKEKDTPNITNLILNKVK